MKRNSSYEKDLAKELIHPSAVQSYLLGLTEGEDGLPLDPALQQTIKRMGVKEFCKMTKIPMPNVSEFISGKRKLKPETIEKYLKPFDLKIRLIVEKAS